jgi:hypothetical protein
MNTILMVLKITEIMRGDGAPSTPTGYITEEYCFSSPFWVATPFLVE